jgi:hypothetical protein
MSRISIIMIAITRRMWMNPPTVYDVTIPKNHKRRSMTAIVTNIGVID